MDFVPNHSSDEHEWFRKSVSGIGKYKDYYVWKEGKNDNESPPNNWISMYFKSAWEFNEKRNLWYLHNFVYKQPDLNFENHEVQREMKVSFTSCGMKSPPPSALFSSLLRYLLCFELSP